MSSLTHTVIVDKHSGTLARPSSHWACLEALAMLFVDQYRQVIQDKGEQRWSAEEYCVRDDKCVCVCVYVRVCTRMCVYS